MQSKLQLIAKLSGSFSLGAAISQYSSSGVGEQILDNEAGWNPASLFLPVTAQCFSLLGSSGVTKTVRLSPIRAKTANGQEIKIYPVAARVSPISSQFTFYNLRAAILRGALFAYFPMIEQYLRELQEAEQEAHEHGDEFGINDAPDFDWKLAKERLPIALLNVVKEICVGIVRVLLGWGIATYLDDRLAWKLMKEQSSSLRAKKIVPFYLRPYRVTKTVIRGSLIPMIAEILVSSTIDLLRILQEKMSPEEKFWLMVRRQTAYCMRSIILLVSGALGAGVVGFVRPGFFCTLAALGTQFAVDTFICLPEMTSVVNKGRVSRRLSWMLIGSGALLVLSFWPWFSDPTTALQDQEVPVLALS